VSASLASLYRYPVKGFTPEALDAVTLAPGRGLPHDRAYAVEDGPSGFDPAAPAHISKMKFTVLAKIPAVARIKTRFEEAGATFHAELDGEAAAFPLEAEGGRAAFATWLEARLGEAVRGLLRVLPGPGAHRFYDHPQGALSLINLASVEDLGRRLGRPLDPLRFRANLYVEGWPAWAEQQWVGRRLRIGEAEAEVFAETVRCAATHVDPQTGVRDVDLVPALWEAYGHKICGVYLTVTAPGALRPGDAVRLS